MSELIKNINLGKRILNKNSFCWKEGPGYSLDQNKLIATHVGNNSEYYTVVADKPLPKESISSWKVKLRNYTTNYSNLMIGVAPINIDQQKKDNYYNSWTFDCLSSKLLIKSCNWTNYKSSSETQLKTNDIIGVKMDTKKGELSFSVNGADYGVAYNSIPTNIDINPIILLLSKGDSIELIK